MTLNGLKMQGTVGSAGPLNLFRSLSRMASLLILDMGLFSYWMVVLGFPVPLNYPHLSRSG
jgi:hypothetical protein